MIREQLHYRHVIIDSGQLAIRCSSNWRTTLSHVEFLIAHLREDAEITHPWYWSALLWGTTSHSSLQLCKNTIFLRVVKLDIHSLASNVFDNIYANTGIKKCSFISLDRRFVKIYRLPGDVNLRNDSFSNFH